MLSRVARGLYDLGRAVERTQHVVRILEVNHKMNLERAANDEYEVWSAVSEAFDCELDYPDEQSLYGLLVLSDSHPFSVRRGIADARDRGRAMREHISEEMWLHLNRTHLELAELDFDAILEIGRSEFNRRIEIFVDALFGLADDTMIRGESWSFLRIGKFAERATMICRILEIKKRSIVKESEGEPVDVHQWQALLRCLSGYEPYRRAYDARILPERILEFVLQRPDFPRSLTCTLGDMRQAIQTVSGHDETRWQLDRRIEQVLEELRSADPFDLIASDSFESERRHLDRRCAEITQAIDLAFFTSRRPAAGSVLAAPALAGAQT